MTRRLLQPAGRITLPRVTRAISSSTSGRAGRPIRSAWAPCTKNEVSSVAPVCLQTSVTSCRPGSCGVYRAGEDAPLVAGGCEAHISDLPDGALIRAVTSPVSGSPLFSATLARARPFAALAAARVSSTSASSRPSPCSAGRPSSARPAPRNYNGTCLRPLFATPGAVGPHKEDLARAESSCHQQGQPAELVGDILVDAEHFGAGLGPVHRRIPLKAREVFPNVGVVVLRVGQLGEQAAPAVSVSSKWWRARFPTAGLGADQHHGAKAPSSLSVSVYCRPCQPGMKTRPLAWCSTMPFSSRQSSLVSWPSSRPTSPEHDVEFRQLVSPCGNCLM